ncbi:MAG: helix-turn-helix domain-containing protein [Chloroflexota bacterium]
MAADPPKAKVPRLLTTSQAARLMGVKPATLRDWIKDGRLVARILPGAGPHGRRYRVLSSALELRLSASDKGRTAGTGEG